MKLLIAFKIHLYMCFFVLIISPFTVMRVLCDGFEGIGGDFKDLWEEKYYIFGNPGDWGKLGL